MARVSFGIRLGVLCLALLLGAAGASRPGRPIADRSRSPPRRAFRANARVRSSRQTLPDPSTDPSFLPRERRAVATDERRHILTDIPEANDDIDAVAAFPATPDVSAGFPSKAPLKILLGFRNNGDAPVNVTHIAASLNVPQMFSFYVTNFTVQTPLVTVEPGKEASFEYLFVLDPALAGHDFVLAATVFYEDEAERFASTFHNATISVLDPVGAFDAQTLTVKLVLLALALALAYLAMAAAGALPTAEKALKKAVSARKKSPAKARETGTGRGARAADNEWLEGTSWKEGKSQ